MPGASQSPAWDHPEAARAYARFVRTCPLVRELGETLVSRTLRPGDRSVADLGAATGATTAALLAHVGPSATVFAVEPSAAMIEHSRKSVQDRRVRWLRGDARVLKRARPAASLDAVVCNAALWLDPRPAEVLTIAAEMLHPGGRLGLTIPAEHVGEVEHLLSDEATAFTRALEEVRRVATAGSTPLPVVSPPGPAEPDESSVLPPSRTELARLVEESGFSEVCVDDTDVLVSGEERAAWYALPPMLERWLPETGKRRRAAALRILAARASSLPALRLHWLVVTATRQA
jgi:trans-aconitate methyltransferase